MARARSFPSDFLKDPDVITLVGADECLILIGLILNADDYGRGSAHSLRLGREIRGYTAEQIESALHLLEEAHLLTLYEVGRFRYYSLPRWNEWEKLSDPAKSKYPAPPGTHNSPEEVQVSQKLSKKPGETLRNVQEVQKPAPEGEGEGEEETETESESEREREEEEAPTNVVSFPTAHSSDTATVSLSPDEIEKATREVASILVLPRDAALKRIVEDYYRDSSLSLFGEADAAREWIDDTRRNCKGQRMTPAFFRRWLKREHDDVLKRQATGTNGPSLPVPLHSQDAARGTPDDDPYAAFLEQRTREVTQASAGKTGGTQR